MAKSKLETSAKRLAISKANAQMVIIVSVASFVTVFCLVASKAVWSQTRYQSRVTSKDETAHQQLQKNIQAFDELVKSYKTFDAASPNVIGATGVDNAQIVLDALPAKYDFPALASSIEKILTTGNYNISNITGTDAQLTEQGNNSSPNPQPVPMPFSFSVDNTSYSAVQQLISTLQSSVRPMPVDSITLTGGTDNMTLTVNAHTYYQPGKTVTITNQAVK